MSDTFDDYLRFAYPHLRTERRGWVAPMSRAGERYVRVAVDWLRWAASVSPRKSAVMTALALGHVAGLTGRSQVEVKKKIESAEIPIIGVTMNRKRNAIPSFVSNYLGID